jgi:hypothetical protein
LRFNHNNQSASLSRSQSGILLAYFY